MTADLNIQVTSGGPSTSVELCAFIDGTDVASQLPCDIHVGWAETGAGYEAEHFVHTYTVTHGSHTVQAFVRTADSAATLGFYSNVYNVYKKLR